MPTDRNIVLRLQSVVSGSVGRAFASVNENVAQLEESFRASGQEVGRLTRELRDARRAGLDVSDIERRLEQAKDATARWRVELQRVNARMERLDQARARLDGIAGAFSKLNIASGLFSAAIGFGLNELGQQVAEISEAANRAGLGIEQGSRAILAASRAGIRDASGFVEEWKEIPRAIAEAASSAERFQAFSDLGLDANALAGADPTEQFIAIATAARNADRETRQFLLEQAGLTGLLNDNLLQLAGVSDSAFRDFVDGARNGAAVSIEQAQASREMQAEIAKLKQEVLLGGLAIVQEYLPAIRAAISAFANGVSAALEFVAANRPLIIALASVGIAAVAVGTGFKVAAVGMGLYQAAVRLLTGFSWAAWSNPIIAALAGIGIALSAAVWLFSLFNRESDKAANARVPDAPSVDSRRVGAQAAAFTAAGQGQADAITPYFSQPAPPAERPGARPSAAVPYAPASPAERPAPGPIVNNYYVTVDLSVVVSGAESLAQAIADELPAALQSAMDAGVKGREAVDYA